MINIKLVKKNFKHINYLLKTRNFDINYDFITNINKNRIYIQNKYENIKSEINKISKLIGFDKNNNEYINKKIEYIKNLKKEINFLKNKLNNLKKITKKYYYSIPNIPSIDTLKKKKIIYYGNKKKFNFIINDYLSIGKKTNGIDFKLSSKISGSKFVIMRNKIASVHRALIQFMLDIHINKFNYEEIYVPLMVNKESLYGTGQFPKFYNDVFSVNKFDNKNKYYLIPTSEVPLINIARNKIFLEKELPIKMVSYTPCFRSESNSYGKNFKGLIRLHQFDKVEIVQIVKPNNSNIVLDEIVHNSEYVLKLLNLHYRIKLLKPKDMSFSSCKTYDIEVWFPYENKYIEVSSCSNTSDFQSRRILSKFKNNNNKVELVHILNGSGLAVGRTLSALIENYQNSNFDFDIPNILKPYINSYIY